MRNRGISQHAKAVQEMLFHYITQQDTCVTFKTLTDFEQAFDNLSNRYLKILLTFLNFGPDIICLIMSLNSCLVTVTVGLPQKKKKKTAAAVESKKHVPGP